MIDYWLRKTTLNQPRLIKVLLLAPLAVIPAVIVFAVFVSEDSLAMGLLSALLIGAVAGYPMAFIGCLIFGLPLYAILKRTSFQYGFIYPLAGFLIGTYLVKMIMGLFHSFLSLLYGRPELFSFSEAIQSGIEYPTPLMGAVATAVGAAGFWLLVRTDRGAQATA